MAAKSKVTEKTPLTTPLTATPKPPRRTELDTTALDGLRGFAAMHLGLGEWLLRAYPDLPVDLAHHASMCTFYVLSGYVLGLVYLKPNQVVFTCCSPADANDGTPRFRHGRFFVRRLARLYPMYLLANGIAAIVDIKLNGMWGLPDDYKSGERLVLVLFVATAFIRAPFLDWFYTTYDGASWAVSLHFLTYLCFPFICASMQRVPPSGVALPCMVLIACVTYGVLGTVSTQWTQEHTFPPFLFEYYGTAWWHLMPFFVGVCGGWRAVSLPASARRPFDGRVSAADGWLLVLFLGIIVAAACSVSLINMVIAQYGHDGLATITNGYPGALVLLYWMPLPLVFMLSALTFAPPVDATAIEPKAVATADTRLGAAEAALAPTPLPPDFAGGENEKQGSGSALLTRLAREVAALPALPTYILRSRVGQWLGEISMCYYLTHLLIFQACVRFEENNPSVQPYQPLHTPYWLAVYGVSLLAAWVLTHYFELPCARALEKCFAGVM